MARKFELVIFDNDGVVVDSEPLASLAMSEVLALAGCPLTPEQCDELFMGGTLERSRQIVAERFAIELPEGFERSYTQRLFALMKRGLKPVDGIEAVLDALDAAVMPYCLASSGRRNRLRFSLEAAGMIGRFQNRWWGAEDVSEGKPSPELFLLAAKSMGAAPAACAVVEDSELGTQAARAAGMTVFGFAARTPAAKLAGAEAVFKSMRELPALLLATA